MTGKWDKIFFLLLPLIVVLTCELAFSSELIRTQTKLAEVYPNIGTSEYISGDQLGEVEKVSDAVSNSGGTGLLQTLTLFDRDSEAINIDVWFFQGKAVPTSTDNQPINITDAGASTAKLLGVVSVLASDYKTTGNGRIATVNNIGLPLKSLAKSKDVYIMLEARSTVTFSAIDDLSLTLGILQD